MQKFYTDLRKLTVRKVCDKSKRSNAVLDMNLVKSVLIVRDDNKIGDMIVSTVLFREIKKKYPDIKIYVLCGESNKQIIQYNPYIEKYFVVTNNNLKNLIICNKIRKYKIDLVFDFDYLEPRHFYKLLRFRIINPKFLTGVHKKNYNMYDFSLDLDIDNIHVIEIYKKVLELIGIKDIDDKYDIFLSEKEEEYAKQIKEQFGNSKIVFINTHASNTDRTLTLSKTINLVKNLTEKFNNDSGKIKFIVNTYYDIKQNDFIFVPEKSNFLNIVALVKISDVIVTPDTSIVHAARAFNKKMVALYRGSNRTSVTWAPYYDNAVQLVANSKYKRETEEINSIENSLITDNIKKLLNQKDNI